MRFRLSDFGYESVNQALSMAGYRYDHNSLEAVCLNYLAAKPAKLVLDSPAEGQMRFLVRLFPDEYEIIRTAFDEAREFTASDTESLVMICNLFIHLEKINEL